MRRGAGSNAGHPHHGPLVTIAAMRDLDFDAMHLFARVAGLRTLSAVPLLRGKRLVPVLAPFVGTAKA